MTSQTQPGVHEVIEAKVREEGLLSPGRRVLVMLSGGRDSTALLHLAAAISGAPNVRALHVNHGLRSSAADEEAHCRELCARHRVELEVRHLRRPSGSGNLQAWGRRERYAAASELAERGDADIAAGHTATDQVETILYRLASSPSRRALLGMRSRDGRLIRPLLSLTREQTAALCRARGLTWRDDESNESRAYARVRARQELVPALRSLHPAAERNVLALAETLRAEAEVLDELVGAVLNGQAGVELARLRSLPPALAALVVQRLADGAAGAPAPGAARRTEEILRLGDHAALDLPHGVRALVRDGALSMLARSEAAGRAPQGSPGAGGAID